MKLTTSVIPIALTALICGLMAAGLKNDPRALPSALIDKPMPEFDLPPIEATRRGFAKADLTGQVALVNVFASWCVACRLEHPTLMELAERKRVAIYGVDWKDDPKDGATWLRAFGDPYLLVGEDRDSRLAMELGVTGAPETFVIDRTGRIRFKQIGPITDEVWRETIEPLVAALEKEPAQ
ncbi:MAG: DsbE family thiol:disulfide interchange protein [Parvularculaceae bacterium]